MQSKKHHSIFDSQREQLRYLPQSVKLEEAVSPYMVHITMAVISLCIILFVLWAAFTSINETAHASGEVMPRGFVQNVQHLDGGIITEILVGEGDIVKEGQLLLRIDDGSTRHDLLQQEVHYHLLSLQSERISALLEERVLNLSHFNGLEDEERIQQENMFAALLAAYEAQNILLSGKMGGDDALTAFQATYRSDAYHKLNQLQDEMRQSSEQIKKLKEKLHRLDIRAPVQGLVKGLRVNTIGGVIASSESLMQIVPIGKSLVIEARINPKDIAHIKIGQTVQIKIGSYDFARYGMINGILEFISATTFRDANSAPYYHVRIALLQNYVGHNEMRNMILPGMTAEIGVITGRKTVLEYLLKPIHVSLKLAMSER